jgi:hypothetical protein
MKIEEIFYPLSETPVDENTFDLEKWRCENPMDYFKALYILNQADGIAKDVIFQEIYKITRLYIPDTLYKYYSLTTDVQLNEQKIKTLRQGNIYVSDIKDFNDPFDGKAYYYNADELKKYERLSDCDGKLIDDFTTFTKATSFTENGVNCMPMWAHYANNHQGFCVSYDMKSNVQLYSCTFPVQYTNQRLDITSLMDSQVAMLVKEMERQSQMGHKKILIDDLSLIYTS